MRHAPSGLSIHLLTTALLLSLTALPTVARAEEPEQTSAPLRVALDVGGTLAAMRHPAAPLPPSPVGFPRFSSDRDTAARATFGVHVALSQFFDVENLWESNALDWYFSKDVQVFSLRFGLEKELPLSRRFSLGLAVHAAAAEASIGAGETSFGAPPIPDTGPAPDSITEVRAFQWLFGASGTVSLLVLTNSPVYFRLQAGYIRYFQQARHFEFRGRDLTPGGFSVSLSGPTGGVSMGFRL
ncbi:hypothetical protein [Hyalangium gracile]|uniref:hypothetical protein n=1 Tax=Hyalangium gracile TaxID=394092 RepID=UPI001CCC6F17|nr:hypothetical protein [Hyalangium gracile]